MIKLCLSVLILFSVITLCNASDFKIFGKITTVDNEIYTGYITWNHSKTLWIDFFEAGKVENLYTTYFNKSTGIKFQQNGEIHYTPSIHQFSCRFGNMKKIRLIAPNKIELELKGNQKLVLKKGQYNDIGTPVRLENDTLQLDFIWDHISEIEFMSSPSSDVQQLSFGVVKSNHASYTGIIEWNNRGQNNAKQFHIYAYSKEVNIPLRLIKKIERKSEQSITIFTDQHDYNIKTAHSNNNQQKSVTVLMPNIGKVIIPWDHLETLEFTPQESHKLLSYNDFKSPEALQAEILTQDGERLIGTVAYDLDESLNCEIIEGMNDNITYFIPLRYIQSIEPKNYLYSFVTLKNGSALSLGDMQDMNLDNNGIMVFIPQQLPVYVPWNEVKKSHSVNIRNKQMNRSEYNTSVDQFSDSVYRFILKACRNKQMAEDIVQDSFFVLWEHVRELQYNKAKAFLFTTAYRKMIDQFRREKRNVDVSTIDSSQLTTREENIDLQEILEYALSRLSTIQQTVILLRDYEDYSYQEIAEITGLNESQVKVYIFRGRSSMKQFIRKSDLVI